MIRFPEDARHTMMREALVGQAFSLSYQAEELNHAVEDLDPPKQIPQPGRVRRHRRQPTKQDEDDHA